MQLTLQRPDVIFGIALGIEYVKESWITDDEKDEGVHYIILDLFFIRFVFLIEE